MKTPILLAPMLTLALVGCGGQTSYVKEEKVIEKQPIVTREEVIVEKPVVTSEREIVVVGQPEVTREIVVEPPVVAREYVVATPVPPLRSCTYLSGTFSHGSLSCQAGYQYTCSDGSWVRRYVAC